MFSAEVENVGKTNSPKNVPDPDVEAPTVIPASAGMTGVGKLGIGQKTATGCLIRLIPVAKDIRQAVSLEQRVIRANDE